MMKTLRQARGTPILQAGPDLNKIQIKVLPEPKVKPLKKLFLSGDVEALTQGELRKAFKRPIKKAGGSGGSAKYLKKRPHQTAKEGELLYGR